MLLRPSPSPSSACILLAGIRKLQGRRSMARFGSRSSASLSIPAAGLASILRDHKARSNVLLGTLAPPAALIASSPESLASEADIAEEDSDELKEEDVWDAKAGVLKPDASKPIHYGEENGFHYMEPRYGRGFSKKRPGATLKSLGLGLGFEKVHGDWADSQCVVPKAKMRENGAMGDVLSEMVNRKTNAGEGLGSSSRRPEQEPFVADALANGMRSCHTSLESSLFSHVKSPSHRSMSWMIPQLGGVGEHSPRRHAERQSAPVQVPDWSKIMVKHRGKAVAAEDDRVEGDKDDGDDDDDDDDDDRLPPHELLAREYARSQWTPFSVCEGQGRTLKGRDLSRVRDAVWSQMGFAD